MPSQGGFRLQNPQPGQVQLDLKFKNPLTQTITCLVMGMFQGMLTIDKSKNVTMEAFGV
jgi:hypothetical protein